MDGSEQVQSIRRTPACPYFPFLKVFESNVGQVKNFLKALYRYVDNVKKEKPPNFPIRAHASEAIIKAASERSQPFFVVFPN